MTVTEFLLARLAEDEAEADTKHDTAYHDYENCGGCGYPERVLAEVEAKRRIVAWHADWGPHTCPSGMNRYRPEPDESWIGCPELLALASIYSDHTDYNEAWRV